VPTVGGNAACIARDVREIECSLTARRDTKPVTGREAMVAGEPEGLVLKDRTSTCPNGSRAAWSKVNDPSWFARSS